MRHTWALAPDFDGYQCVDCECKVPRVPFKCRPKYPTVPASFKLKNFSMEPGVIVGVDYSKDASDIGPRPPCRCPMHGPDGLLAVGCKCGAI